MNCIIVIKLAFDCQRPQVVSVRSDKYLILFGESDKIYVLDVKLQKVYKCDIKCPITSGVKCAVSNTVHPKQELITFGFIRNLWKNKQFSNMRYPAVAVSKLIDLYGTGEETIHLFSRYLHWTMDVEEILNNTHFDS